MLLLLYYNKTYMHRLLCLLCIAHFFVYYFTLFGAFFKISLFYCMLPLTRAFPISNAWWTSDGVSTAGQHEEAAWAVEPAGCEAEGALRASRLHRRRPLPSRGSCMSVAAIIYRSLFHFRKWKGVKPVVCGLGRIDLKHVCALARLK